MTIRVYIYEMTVAILFGLGMGCNMSFTPFAVRLFGNLWNEDNRFVSLPLKRRYILNTIG